MRPPRQACPPDRPPARNWWANLSPVVPRVLAPAASGRPCRSGQAPERPSGQAAPVAQAAVPRLVPPDLEPPVAPALPVALEHPPAAVAALWNSSANPSAVTEAVPEAARAVLAVLADQPLPSVQGCRVACESPWHPASSCSSRNRSVARPHHHYGVQIPRPNPVLESRPLHPWRGRHLLQPRAVLDSVPEQPQVSADPDGPTGMTAPSWKPCAAVHRRSSARKSTSSARTMMPSPLKPAVSPASSRLWSCLPAWRDLPSRNPSRGPRRSQWRRCGNARRRPPVNASVDGPWNFAPPARPRRCGRRC